MEQYDPVAEIERVGDYIPNEDDGDFSECGDIIIGKLRLVINYRALPLEGDDEYKGSDKCIVSKEYSYGSLEEFENRMDVIRLYIHDFYLDENVLVLDWKLICEEGTR